MNGLLADGWYSLVSNFGMSGTRFPLRDAAAITAAVTVVVLAATSAVAQQDAEKIEAGIEVYNNNCVTCHGENLVSSGQTADLRGLQPGDRQRFQTSVEKGKGQMPPWKGVLDDAQIDAVWAYVMSKRH